jgi:hypothetical protein
MTEKARDEIFNTTAINESVAYPNPFHGPDEEPEAETDITKLAEGMRVRVLHYSHSPKWDNWAAAIELIVDRAEGTIVSIEKPETEPKTEYSQESCLISFEESRSHNQKKWNVGEYSIIYELPRRLAEFGEQQGQLNCPDLVAGMMANIVFAAASNPNNSVLLDADIKTRVVEGKLTEKTETGFTLATKNGGPPVLINVAGLLSNHSSGIHADDYLDLTFDDLSVGMFLTVLCAPSVVDSQLYGFNVFVSLPDTRAEFLSASEGKINLRERKTNVEFSLEWKDGTEATDFYHHGQTVRLQNGWPVEVQFFNKKAFSVRALPLRRSDSLSGLHPED